MKRIALACAVSGLALTAAAPASAGIFIGISINGGPITQVATDGLAGSANYVATTGGYFYNTGATGSPIVLQPNLLTQSINLQQAGGTGGTVSIYITQTDLSAFNGYLLSSFTSNLITNATAVLSTYYSASNALYGGTLLQSASFDSIGTFANGNLLAVTGPFSETVRYDLTFGSGSGNFNGTVNLANAVPEPATWGMIIFGFLGLGHAMRRRQRVTARVRFA